MFPKKINGKTSFCDATILEVELCFYGLCGGDSGHGAFLDLSINAVDSFYVNEKETHNLNLHFTGDAEIRNFIRLCRYVNDILGDVDKENLDRIYEDSKNY